MSIPGYTQEEKIALIKDNGYQVQTIKVTVRDGRRVSSSDVEYAYKEGVRYTIEDAFNEVLLELIANPASGSGAYVGDDGINVTGVDISVDLKAAGSGMEFIGGKLGVDSSYASFTNYTTDIEWATLNHQELLHWSNIIDVSIPANVANAMASWVLDTDNEVTADITDGEKITFSEGNNITVVRSGAHPNNVITVSATGLVGDDDFGPDSILYGDVAGNKQTLLVPNGDHFIGQIGADTIQSITPAQAKTMLAYGTAANFAEAHFSLAGHTHDGRYYTEAEIDAFWVNLTDGGTPENLVNWVNVFNYPPAFDDVMTGFSIDTDGEAATLITEGETILFSDGANMSVVRAGNTITFASTQRGIDNVPVDAELGESITSNWAFQHKADASAHHVKYTNANAVAAVAAADDYLKNDANDTTSGFLTAAGFLVGSDPVFHEGDEDWQTNGTATPTMNMHTSRNMELTPSTNATTLSFSNTHDGMSGVVVVDASVAGTLTLPVDSHPLTIAYTDSSRVIASFVKYSTEYIWQTTTFANAPL